MYHRIAEDSFDPWGMAVKPAHFREQLAWLAQNRTLLRLQEFADLHRRGLLARNAVSITFDDGYSCAGEVAAPLLEQFRTPATIFLPVDLIERRRPFWWDELEEIVLGYGEPTITIDEEEIPLGQASPADRRWSPRCPAATPRQSAFEEILSRITRKKPAERDSIMDDLRRHARRSDGDRSSKRPMTPEEVRRIASDRVEFGSHTRTHPWLPQLGPEEQAAEIGGSIDRLQSLTGSRPISFAYPYGMSDKPSRQMAESAGFDCACVTGDLAVSRRTASFALPRVRVGDWDAQGLESALSSLLPA
jgi:peptidoglycan/xylan/chitin deacetylase (PgdA/CDA1 family)